MINNTDLQNEMLSKIKPFISSLEDNDIYAISFEFVNMGDNPCEPVLSVTYNTERDYQKELAIDYGYTVSASAKRWDCANWPRENYINFGDSETIEIIKQWIIGMGLQYRAYNEFFGTGMSSEDFADMCDKYSVIEDEFIKILVCIIKHLHETDFIKNKFGKDIPITIYVHGDGYDVDKLVVQNIEANTAPLVQDYVDYLITPY